MKYFSVFAGICLLLLMGSCVDIFDEITIHDNGSGTYKYTINLSASKVKINSILALDSIDGKRVPDIDEIKNKIELYRNELGQKEGISNVTVDANYDDFVFKFSCDFTSVTALQNAIKEVVRAESKDRDNLAFNDSWISWDGSQLVRAIPGFQTPLNKLKGEDQEALKKGKYLSVARFDSPVVKCDNPNAQISPTKTAVMVKSTPFAVAQNPGLLKSTITVDTE